MKLVFFIATILFSLVSPDALADVPTLAKIKAAAESGNAEAQYLFAKSFGPLNAEWTKWLSAAAAQGYGPAEDELAWVPNWAKFQTNHTDPKARAFHLKTNGSQMRQALIYASSAADKEFGRSRLILAMAYANGYFVSKDLVESYKWLKLSVCTDILANAAAASERDRLLKAMPLEQVKEGEARAAIYRPGNSAQEIFKAMVVPSLKLMGVVGSNSTNPSKAIINGKTINIGEEKQLDLNGIPVRVRCLSIEKTGVIIVLLPSETKYRLFPNTTAELVH